MTVVAGKIVAERWKYGNNVWFVYTPTGTGDWVRWRIATQNFITGSEATYPCICGAERGQVYSGISKLQSEADQSSGSYTQDEKGVTFASWSETTAHRLYNVPSQMTYFRACGLRRATTGVLLMVQYDGLNGSGNVVATAEWDLTNNTYVGFSAWTKIETTCKSIKFSRKTGGGASNVMFAGVDFVNPSIVSSPDVAGSMMLDACFETINPAAPQNGFRPMDAIANTRGVVEPQGWGESVRSVLSTQEIACYWANRGGAFSDANVFGGINHGGIGLATTAWTYQTGTDDPAAWSPDGGDKVVCDFLIMDITTATVYLEALRTTPKGTLAGKLIFNCTGVIIDHQITTAADMDVFKLYTMQCRMPMIRGKVYFEGDTANREYNQATLVSTIKSEGVTVWGGSNDLAYRVYALTPDDNYYYAKVSSGNVFLWVFANTQNSKVYQLPISQDVPVQFDSGSTFGNRFKISVMDKKFMVPVSVIPESYYGRQLRSRSNKKPF